MRYLWPILLQALAFGVGIAEAMVVSYGILTAVCAALMLYSWYYVVAHLPPAAAYGFGLADLILLPVGVKIAFGILQKSSISHGFDLGAGSGLEGEDQRLHPLVGQTAVVEAPLRPTGKIRVGDEVFEAQAAGDFVAKGARVKVTAVAGSRFQVEKL